MTRIPPMPSSRPPPLPPTLSTNDENEIETSRELVKTLEHNLKRRTKAHLAQQINLAKTKKEKEDIEHPPLIYLAENLFLCRKEPTADQIAKEGISELILVRRGNQSADVGNTSGESKLWKVAFDFDEARSASFLGETADKLHELIGRNVTTVLVSFIALSIDEKKSEMLRFLSDERISRS